MRLTLRWVSQGDWLRSMTTDRSIKKETTRMERKMDFLHSGMRAGRRGLKETSRMERKKDLGLCGMRTDRRSLKKTTRMVRKMDF